MRKYCILCMGVTVFFLTLLFFGTGTVARASSADAVWPESSGEVIQSDGKLVIDASHMDLGYVMCCVDAPTDRSLKIRVTFNNGAQLMYDLDNAGDYEVFPLQLGSGNYEFALFQSAKGGKYSAEGKITLQAKLSDENAAFLVPNQYVDYVQTTNAVLKSDARFQTPMISTSAVSMTRKNGIMKRFLFRATVSRSVSPMAKARSCTGCG